MLHTARAFFTTALTAMCAWTCHGGSNVEMVGALKAAGIISSPQVQAAMEAVDRARFVRHMHDAYIDAPQPIGWDATISAPHMHGYCLELLEDKLRPGAKVLDVGSGSGYLTAVMARMVAPPGAGPQGTVVGVEHVPQLVARSRQAVSAIPWAAALLSSGRMELVVGDGRAGYAPHAPYDAIHVGAGAPEVPQQLVAQLAPGGRMVVPVGPPHGGQSLMLVERSADGQQVQARDVMGVRYVPLTSLPAHLASGR